MPNIVSSTAFCIRNVDKAEHRKDDVSRASVLPVVIGQLHNTVNAIDDTVSAFNGRGILTRAKALAGEDKLVQTIGKTAKWAGTYVNPLICVASAADALTSEDKPAAIATNGSAVLSMFGAEYLMKKHMAESTFEDVKLIKNIAAKVGNFVSKHCSGKLASALTEANIAKVLPKATYGSIFLVGSILGYTIGSKIGHSLISMARGDSQGQMA